MSGIPKEEVPTLPLEVSFLEFSPERKDMDSS